MRELELGKGEVTVGEDWGGGVGEGEEKRYIIIPISPIVDKIQ